MPEMRFRIRWPGGEQEDCYSPSLVIKDYFAPGEAYPLAEFVTRSRDALTIASQRVEARYGRPCSLALGQLRSIETTALRFAAMPEARVAVLAFQE